MIPGHSGNTSRKNHKKLLTSLIHPRIRRAVPGFSGTSWGPLLNELPGRQHDGEAGWAEVSRMAETREVMDIREASQYLGVSRDTLYKYVSEDKIPAFKLGNRWKFKKTVLDRWMDRQSTRSEEQVERRGRVLTR